MENKQGDQHPMVSPVGPAPGKQDVRFQEFCHKLTPEQLQQTKDQVGKEARRPSSVGTSLQAYTEKHASDLTRIKELVDNPNWAFKKNKEDVDIFTMLVPGEKFASYKAHTMIKTQGKGIQHIFLGLLQVQDRPKWDEMCIHGEMLECYLPYYRVSYYQMKSPIPGIVCDRDILLRVRPFFEEDGSIVAVAQSCEMDEKPEERPFVRANVLMNAYIIRPTEDPDEFSVTVVGSFDACGWLPHFLKNLIMWKQGLSLAKLRAYLQDSEAEPAVALEGQ